jgi:isopenicillin N synthase-like dioxygenase
MAPSIAQATDVGSWPVPKYERPAQTKENLEWAPLVEIDVSRFDEPGEKQRLAAKLEDAVRNVGFWIVTGHGIKDEEVLRQLAIATAFFHLPMEEKIKVPIDLGNDLNWGFREPVREMGPTGLKESVETVHLHFYLANLVRTS